MMYWKILRPASEDAQNAPPRIIQLADRTIEIGPLPSDAPLTLSIITMDPGDKIPLENITEPLIGAYLSYGELIDGDGGTRVFDGTWTTEWASDPKTGIFTAGPQGAGWVCLQGTSLSVSLLRNALTIPANTGFVLAKGAISFDGVAYSTVRYFKPRPTDMPIIGTADLLLVSQ